ncbi:MAG TPA: hypothetical protein ENL08_04410, partial [Bacteroidetes bacterium]|nr:hypothetical protein [Bacteroidota bacterium]
MAGLNRGRLGSLIAIMVLSVIPSLGFADAVEWRAMTSMHGVHDIVYSNGTIWCATTGGLAGFDPSTEYFDSYTFLDGLEGIGLNGLTLDSTGGIWIVLERRLLQRFDPLSRRVTHTVSGVREVNSINGMTIDQRGIFLATNVGVARIKYFPEQDEWFWFERFTRLGDFPDQEAVTTVVTAGDYIWAGTAMGIARGDLNAPAPLTWVNFTTDDGLPGNEIRDIAVYEDLVYTATNGGIAGWDGSNWTTVSNNLTVSRLIVQNDELYAVTGDGLLVFERSAWNLVGAPITSITSTAKDDEGNIWIGLESNNRSSGGVSALTDGN